MSGVVKFNFAVLRSWQQTCTVAFNTLRRIAFIVEDSFQFGDFDPQTNYNGMTLTLYQVKRARFLKIWKFLWLSIDIVGTVAVPLASGITITIPDGCTVAGLATDYQAFGADVVNNGTSEAGFARAIGLTNAVTFYRTASGNFGAGVSEITANGFLEIV